jgi:hypothetical protein
MAGTEDATFHWDRFLTLIAISGGTLAGALGATNLSTRWLVPLWIISGSCAIAAMVYAVVGLVRWARQRRSNQGTSVPDKDTEPEPGVEDVTRKLFELLEVHLELTKQLLEAQTKASPAVVEQAVERAAAQGRIRLRSTAKGQVITRRETIYDEEGRVAGEETVYDDGHRDAAAYPKTVAA